MSDYGELHQAKVEWFEEKKRALELEAENARLRKALEKIASGKQPHARSYAREVLDRNALKDMT